jgi:glucan 1,3-beta-glucosidase
MVRLPIGYWAMLTQEELDARNEHYITGQLHYLTRGIQWLKKHNIKCIIDLHGAPGSQNGWDNSGQLGAALWGQTDTVNRTIDVIEKLAIFIRTLEEDNSTSDTVVGLELMNEAAPWAIAGGLSTVKSYYLQAYPVVRRHLPASKYIVMIEEAFSPYDWIGFMNSSEYENVVLDVHLYQCFDWQLQQASYDTHLNVTCQIHQNMVAVQSLPTVVGEWSVAFKVESAFANTEPYPNTGEISFMREFALTQIQVFGSHFFWNFKCESAPMWDYALGLQGGWLVHLPPQDSVDLCKGRR